jgi:predicted regulator of Ras-like GTPase activity (Roadblock/LC7/MglB family)
MSEHDAYAVEVDQLGCKTCGHGRTWTVVGPDGVAIGQSFEDHADAEDLAALLSHVHDAAKAER